MLASAFAASAPSVMPSAAAANANLFVSAENSQFQNTFSGPQVIEVVVIDSDIKDTDKGKGEPDVTVNGNKLRMVQATDGNWYGYFADKTMALIADSTQVGNGVNGVGDGLDFGTFCASTTGFVDADTSFFSQTVGVAFPFYSTNANFLSNGNNAATTSTTITSSCSGGVTGQLTSNGTAMNVIRNEKAVNQGSVSATGVKVGQIGLNATSKGSDPSFNRLSSVISVMWPFIQLYNLQDGGNVVVQYNKGGGVQSTTLKFDNTDGIAKSDLDRSAYPQGAQVQLTISDVALNIDPTDEDSWTFGTRSDNSTAFYQFFTEDGALAYSGLGPSKALTGNLTKLMFDGNAVLKINKSPQGTAVLQIQDNADSIISATNGYVGGTTNTAITAADQPVTITETAPNTGVFGTYDESDVSVLGITSSAARGKSATIDYNDTPKSVVVGFGTASLDIQASDAEWNSGEEIPVKLTDSDANKNSRSDEDLDVNKGDVSLIPALTTGNPFTLGEMGTDSSTILSALFIGNFSGNEAAKSQGYFNVTLSSSAGIKTTREGVAGAAPTVQKYSERALLSGSNATGSYTALLLDFETTGSKLLQSIHDPRPASYSTASSTFHGYNLVNLDIRGISSAITAADVYLINSTDPSGVMYGTGGPNDDDYTVVTTGTAKVNKFLKLTPSTRVAPQSIFLLNNTAGNGDIFDGMLKASNTQYIGALINFTRVAPSPSTVGNNIPVVLDFFSFGFYGDGTTTTDRVANQIVRVEVEETGDNTGVFEGTLEYVMLNQLNVLASSTYTGLTPISDSPTFAVMDDLDEKDAPRVSYNDLGADGVTTQVSDQQDAPTHSGVVSFDKPNYKVADTVTITLEDQDLNTDVDLVDIYTVATTAPVYDVVGSASNTIVLSNGDNLGRLLDITFDDQQWLAKAQTGAGAACTGTVSGSDGLSASGFTLIETSSATGIFTGTYQVPGNYCDHIATTTALVSSTGKDMEVNYVDFRDASGNIIEVGDGAGIRANTGSVSLDRTVYPVPWGNTQDGTPASTTPNGYSVFPIHKTGLSGNIDSAAETLTNGDLTIKVQVNDPDYDVSATGEDVISEDSAASGISAHGPVKVTVTRGSSSVILATAGYSTATGNTGKITVGTSTIDETGTYQTRELGPIKETAPNSGIFEFELPIRYTDGPSDSSLCPSTNTSGYQSANNSTRSTIMYRFAQGGSTDTAPSGTYCILQGDILTVEYTDATDASGNLNTVTDSATFDLRNGALQSDKSVYIIGSDMILTLIEPDFDLNSDQAETYDLDLIEWDSDAATCTIGDRKTQGGCETTDSWDPEPSDLRETGDSTGIFQSVLEIPSTLDQNKLERGEEIVLEYTDWGPSGSDYVGDDSEDVNLTLFTSNFGATVELDQKVYTWTDKVYITIVAPDHNMDSNLVDTIGDTTDDAVKVATRGHDINRYHLSETGADTGIFTGEVILIGFAHDADGNTSTGTNGNDGPFGTGSDSSDGTGPTNGYLQADNDDGITVSFEFSEDETVVGSSLIRWNIGEVSWLEASYPASGTGVVRVIDPDMNWNPEAVDNFDINVWSDSDAGGIDLTVTETNEATGIFEGTVNFSTTDASSGSRLRVAEGDTVTAEYKDNTLPDPYTIADELDITGTSFIGTVVPPLERAPASGARVVDAFGNTLDSVSVDQQVQITADLTNGQDREQAFAYLVQIQDENGVTVSLAWITGSLSAGQSFSPALSWIPTASGTYTATVFVWESVDNPTALSPPVSVDITVS